MELENHVTLKIPEEAPEENNDLFDFQDEEEERSSAKLKVK